MKTWIAKVRDVYSSLDELKRYCECYGIDARLGYNTPEQLWDFNGMIGGSTDPKDFGFVSVAEYKRFTKDGPVHQLLPRYRKRPPPAPSPSTVRTLPPGSPGFVLNSGVPPTRRPSRSANR